MARNTAIHRQPSPQAPAALANAQPAALSRTASAVMRATGDAQRRH